MVKKKMRISNNDEEINNFSISVLKNEKISVLIRD